jgi:hypothetical protein
MEIAVVWRNPAISLPRIPNSFDLEDFRPRAARPELAERFQGRGALDRLSGTGSWESE